jgi:hypothetical protein
VKREISTNSYHQCVKEEYFFACRPKQREGAVAGFRFYFGNNFFSKVSMNAANILVTSCGVSWDRLLPRSLVPSVLYPAMWIQMRYAGSYLL